jgi:hypothetical protein
VSTVSGLPYITSLLAASKNALKHKGPRLPRRPLCVRERCPRHLSEIYDNSADLADEKDLRRIMRMCQVRVTSLAGDVPGWLDRLLKGTKFESPPSLNCCSFAPTVAATTWVGNELVATFEISWSTFMVFSPVTTKTRFSLTSTPGSEH